MWYRADEDESAGVWRWCQSNNLVSGQKDSKSIGFCWNRATNSTAIEAIQTLLGVLCYRPLSGNECIQGLCKLSAGLLLASAQQIALDVGADLVFAS